MAQADPPQHVLAVILGCQLLKELGFPNHEDSCAANFSPLAASLKGEGFIKHIEGLCRSLTYLASFIELPRGSTGPFLKE